MQLLDPSVLKFFQGLSVTARLREQFWGYYRSIPGWDLLSLDEVGGI